ncbi:MAG: hypothetical protein PUE85_02345 [Firmicutes bacterium]|nr:hypothetical protein [Bacillota bacterium]
MTKKIISAALTLLMLATAGCSAASTPEEKAFYASELIKNAELWNGRALLDDRFQFIVEYTSDKIIEDALGVNYNNFGGDFMHQKSSAGEWGYAILHLDGQTDGAGVYHETNFTGENAPKSREEAVEKILDYLNQQFLSKANGDLPLTSMNGHYPWHHYAGMAGYENIGTEIGEGMPSYQLRLAMNRGAAKQYGATWFVDFSQWYGGYILDYRDSNPVWGENSSVNGGHSLNLMERSLLLSFMAGADATIAEGGQYIAYDSQGNITPFGELCQKLYAFTSKYYDIGTTYTPYAVILDKYHGMDMVGAEKVFGTFPCEEPDIFTYNFFNDYIWPGALEGTYSNESSVMANTKYGDSFDLLLQDASYELLETYPVLIFTGNIILSDDELKMYTDYVKNGGTLVLNTAYLEQFEKKGIDFPDLEQQTYKELTYGNGSFMIYGNGGLYDKYKDQYGYTLIQASDDWRLGGLKTILEELHKKYMPFTFSDDIGYTVKVKDGALYLYVFNNRGVYKSINEPEIVYETQSVDLEITYTGDYSVISAEDIYDGHDIALSDKLMSIKLEAGGMAVIEIKLGNKN